MSIFSQNGAEGKNEETRFFGHIRRARFISLNDAEGKYDETMLGANKGRVRHGFSRCSRRKIRQIEVTYSAPWLISKRELGSVNQGGF